MEDVGEVGVGECMFLEALDGISWGEGFVQTCPSCKEGHIKLVPGPYQACAHGRHSRF